MKSDVFLAIPNRATRDGKRLRAMREDLVRHTGGSPTPVQAVLIDRIVMLQWQSMQLDRAAATATGALAVQFAERSTAMANAIGRALSRLGLEPAIARPPTPQEALAAFRKAHPV